MTRCVQLLERTKTCSGTPTLGCHCKPLGRIVVGSMGLAKEVQRPNAALSSCNTTEGSRRRHRARPHEPSLLAGKQVSASHRANKIEGKLLFQHRVAMTT
mmetsp:Transcript_4964/g.11651  ORF Transcript_4964/g.11651 Transcript_4964/m.11651 type:complete len:100 (+) Transcript_4964:20-319(+)